MSFRVIIEYCHLLQDLSVPSLNHINFYGLNLETDYKFIELKMKLNLWDLENTPYFNYVEGVTSTQVSTQQYSCSEQFCSCQQVCHQITKSLYENVSLGPILYIFRLQCRLLSFFFFFFFFSHSPTPGD